MSLGLYGNNARLGLHRIKKIRNEFAHNLDRDLQHERIIKECNALSDYTDKEPLDHIKLEGTPPDMLAYIEGRERRFRFIMAALVITNGLSTERLEHPWRPPQPTVLRDAP
jgi:hypothetical protein